MMELPSAVYSIPMLPLPTIGNATSIRRRRLQSSSLSAPLFEGLGTHYVFIYVGTPPQRVSVIVDTGSHHTAFPCVGCNCGKHMDPLFDPQRSTSAVMCNAGSSCRFSQSYSEGSMWEAVKVQDRITIGTDGSMLGMASVDFNFGCQTRETGLFRTQNVDGIMGMSASATTLPWVLHKAGLTTTKAFSMCFRRGGGVLSLGGINTALHRTPLQLVKANILSSGWYSVRLVEMLMESDLRPGSGAIAMGGDIKRSNAGKGVIVDSGTTDTYLPAFLRNRFEALFRQVSGGISYSTSRMTISEAQFALLPTLIFRLQGDSLATVDLRVPPSSYIDGRAGSYVGRVYLTEGTGAVLGANAMNGHDVVFDPEGKRLGFSVSDCVFTADLPPPPMSQVLEPQSQPKVPQIQPAPIIEVNPQQQEQQQQAAIDATVIRTEDLLPPLVAAALPAEGRPLEPCSARCPVSAATAHRAYGTQAWGSRGVVGRLRGQHLHNCSVGCLRGGGIVPAASPDCLSSAWTDCAGACSQTRVRAARVAEGCVKEPQTRSCHVYKCRAKPGDVILSLQVVVGDLAPELWSYMWKERIGASVGAAVGVPENHVLISAEFVRKGERILCLVSARVRFTADLTGEISLLEQGTRAYHAVDTSAFTLALGEAISADLDASFWGWVDSRRIKAKAVSLQHALVPSDAYQHTNVPQIVTLMEETTVEVFEDRQLIGVMALVLVLVYCAFYFMIRGKRRRDQKDLKH